MFNLFQRSLFITVLLVLGLVGMNAYSQETVGEVGTGPGFRTIRGVTVEAGGTLLVVDEGLQALVRVDPVTGNRTIISDDATGTGTGFVSPFAIALESDGSPVIADLGLGAVFRVDLTTGNRTIVSSKDTGVGPEFGSPTGITVESDGSLVVLDAALQAVLRVDPVTGNRAVVSGFNTGTGPSFATPFGISIEADGKLVVADNGLQGVVRVDPLTGDRTIVSDASTGTGMNFGGNLAGIAVEGTGNLVITDVGQETIIRADPATGNRTVVSNSGTGGGTEFIQPRAIALESDGKLIIGDAGLKAILRVDPVTGYRTVLSIAAEDDGVFERPVNIGIESDGQLVVTDEGKEAVFRVHPVFGFSMIVTDDSTGTGPVFGQNVSVAVEHDGNLVVMDEGLRAVFRVDPVTGDRAIISDDNTGTGPGLVTPHVIDVEEDGTLLVADIGLRAIVQVDPVTGNRTTVSDDNTGTGMGFGQTFGLAVEHDGNLVVADSGIKAVIRVDRATGNRSFLSADGVGTGPEYIQPRDLSVESDGTIVIVDVGLGAVVRVNPVTGDRTIVSDDNTGTGPVFKTPNDVVVQADGTFVVADVGLQALVRVNPITGDRTIIEPPELPQGTEDIIGTISPNTADPGDTGVSVTVALVDPGTGLPSGNPTSVRIGEIEANARSISRTGDEVSATFDFPATEPEGYKDVTLVFSDSQGDSTYTESYGFLLGTSTEQFTGLFLNEPGAYEGYTLFAPMWSTTTYLMDMEGNYVYTWESTYIPGQAAYLMEDGTLLRTGFTDNPRFDAGGTGGIVEMIDKDSNVTWSYTVSDTTQCQHHDLAYLPNGNILMIVWELKTESEALAAGRNPRLLYEGEIWPDKIIEVDPETSNIVWEWHAWDHLIQDYDGSMPNYGTVADHRELIDLNFTITPLGKADWLHVNSVKYIEEFDQIIVSVHNFSEVWVIDHTTTTTEAASHTGGKYGKGGDLLYRWGNPQTYRAGTEDDRKLYVQHDATWLPDNNHIQVFNNGMGRADGDYSSVEELAPPVDDSGNYTTPSAAGTPYGPSTTVWTYTDPVDKTAFYSYYIGGAQRLPNGNTLICEGATGTFFEVDSSDQTVWKYVNPVTGSSILETNEPVPTTENGQQTNQTNSVFKIRRYAPDYPGLADYISQEDTDSDDDSSCFIRSTVSGEHMSSLSGQFRAIVKLIRSYF